MSELYRDRQSINLNPMWQRGQAWHTPKKVLLVDSILRGMDMPKLYFREKRRGSEEVDVVDGQQRLRAIWGFFDGEFSLEHRQPLQPIEGSEVDGLAYSELPKSLKSRLRNFKVSIASITKAEKQDITLLFARLQLAAPLNSAELRNAILCPIRHEVDATATNHPFFVDSRISAARMKHQDYAAHAYALAQNGTNEDLKAPELRTMYIDSIDTDQQALTELSARVEGALEVLAEVNQAAEGRIKQKWIFCDLMNFILEHQAADREIDPEMLAELYVAFDTRRLEYNRRSDDLLDGEVSDEDQNLYDYIQAFRVEGGKQANIERRSEVMRAVLEGSLS